MRSKSVGRQVIMRMIRKMQNGLFIGEGFLILGMIIWFSWTPFAGIPVCIISFVLLYITLKYVVKARLQIRRMEKSGEADNLYREMEKKSCIMSPQTNTIMTDSYIIGSGGRTGFEIIRNRNVVRFWQNDYVNKSGYTRDMILLTGEGKKHHIAFYNSRNPIPDAYQEVVELLKKRLTDARFGDPDSMQL
jgi:hypothetical protein